MIVAESVNLARDLQNRPANDLTPTALADDCDVVVECLPPALFRMEATAANGWYALTVPLGIVVSVVLIMALLRPSARAWFIED